MRRGRLSAAIALTTGMALLGAGCSGGTTTSTSPTSAVEASSGTAAKTTTTESATGTTAKRASTSTTADSSDTTDTTAKGGATGTGSDPDSEFCVQMIKANDSQKAAAKDTESGLPTKEEVETFLTYLDAARAAAPDDAKDPLDTLITAYKDFMAAMDGPNPEETAFTILATNANMAAITALSTIVTSTCGFQLSGTGSDPGTGTGTGTGSGTGSEDGFDCSSITGFSDDAEDPTSISSAKKALCADYGTEVWFKLLANRASWSVSGSDEPTWEIAVYQDEGDATFEADTALQVCAALSTYLETVGVVRPEISIGITHEDAGIKPKEVLASKATTASASDDHAGCVPA